MATYRIDLIDDIGCEISLMVATPEDLIELKEIGWLDCWLDVFSPKIQWSRILGVSKVGNTATKITKPILLYKRAKTKKGKHNRDNAIKPGESKLNNQK